jgi:hypothetical protein
MTRDKSLSEETSRSSQGNALFPWKLHKMLTFCETQGKDTVVSWLPEGKAFKVHNTADFVSEILPMHFKQTKYKSFQRQLNLWGFQRITKGTEIEKGAYFHPNFLKNQEDLCQKLSRQSAKKQSTEAVKSTKSAPKSCAAHVSDDESTSSTPKTRPLVPSPSLSAVPSLVGDSPKDTSFTGIDTSFTGIEATPAIIQPVLFEGCPFFLLEVVSSQVDRQDARARDPLEKIDRNPGLLLI